MNVKKCVRALLCLYLTLIIAMDAVKAQTLKVGDTLPPELWSMPLQVITPPQGKETLTLSEYKDKLIILDFWATWCGACIKSFPKIKELQEKYPNEVEILAVTYESKEVLSKFFTTGVGKNHSYLRTVVEDSVLKNYFPHTGLPHIVWIGTDGKLISTTRADDVNEENIVNTLKTGKSKLTEKVDLDPKRPLFLSEHFTDSQELLSYSILLKGYYAGLPSGNKLKQNTAGKVYGRRMTNMPIMDIYYPVVYELFRSKGESFNKKRLILNVSNPESVYLIPKKTGGYEKTNLLSYEIISSKNTDSLYDIILADLNRNSDYFGLIEKKTVDCLVLTRTSENDKLRSQKSGLKSDSPLVFYDSLLSNVVVRINESKNIILPVIDETGYTGKVDVDIRDVSDINSLRARLKAYDLDVQESRRELNMFILSDKTAYSLPLNTP